MEPNIWNWLLSGLMNVIIAIIAPLFGGIPDLQNAAAFAQPILDGSYVVFDMIYTFFGAFNLTFVGAYLSALILSGVIRGGIVVWFALINTIAKIKSMIPVVG